MSQDKYRNSIAHLKSALEAIAIDKNEPLYRDTVAVCANLENPNFRIAVFGPFNYGKSTLLNALLGKRTLPIDLVPTTGAAIYVRYGEQLQSRITFKDGTVITQEGTRVLLDYAILDDPRRMGDDVAEVEVFCDHPFLKTGVEFLDLPGAHDRAAQDEFVRDRLLSADLIVRVLDARQLTALGERENIWDELLDCGTKAVICVVNFINLLEPDEQKELVQQMQSVAESFSSNLPTGTRNLYRIDALPALRARLKGDIAAAKAAGLAELASALQTIVQVQQEEKSVTLPQVETIIKRVREALQEKIEATNEELEARQQKEKNRLKIQQKAEKLIGQGLQRSSSEFQSWLYLPNLLSCYQGELAAALQQNTAIAWERQFKKTVAKYTAGITEWTNKGCEIFERENLGEVAIATPPLPQVAVSHSDAAAPPNFQNPDGSPVPVAIATGLGLMFGGPMGAAIAGGASYWLKKAIEPKESTAEEPEDLISKESIYEEAAKDYLTRFSNEAFSTLQQYEQQAEELIRFQPTVTSIETTPEYQQIQFLKTLDSNLEQELDLLDKE
ncbi:MAG: dynamin family protein [Cyanobacteriota bacterium]|nr:dynamin family protein [Cyanobacteriota bacterium]